MDNLIFKVIVYGNGSVEIRDRHDNPVSGFGNIDAAKKRIINMLEAQKAYSEALSE